MPQLIKPIDKISREKKIDVLFLSFFDEDENIDYNFNWEESNVRKKVIKWLDENNIEYYPCQIFWQDGLIDLRYIGNLYLDVPFDLNNNIYKKIDKYFENLDNILKRKRPIFFYVPYDYAMKNSHHDDDEYFNKLID